jgi:MYXO-CTERM domain-containing protein
MRGDWRDFRPAIWMAMVAVVVLIEVRPWEISTFLFGAAIGLAAAVSRRRRRLNAAAERKRR